MKKRNIYEMTVQEVWDRIMEVENFQGNRANFEKMQVYRDMERKLSALKKAEPDVKGGEGLPPAPDHANGMVYVDLARLSCLGEDGRKLLAEMILSADILYVSGGEASVRLSFSVCDIWES